MFEGGDNYTRMMGLLVHHFTDVNVGQQPAEVADGTHKLWTLSADAKSVNGEGLFDLVDLCRETGAQPAISNSQLLVIGKD